MKRWDTMRAWYEHAKTNFLDHCSSCGMCVEVCPLFDLADWGGQSAVELQDERLAILRGNVPGDLTYDFTFACSVCSKCQGVCPENLDPLELTWVLRWAICESGGRAPEMLGIPAQDDPASLTNVSAALLTKPSEVRWMTTVEDNPPLADTVLYLGCTVLGMPDQAHTLLDVLDLLRLSMPVLSGPQLCCRAVRVMRGDIADAEHRQRDLVDALSRFRPKKVVLLCYGCYSQIRQTAPHFVDLPFELQHVASFLCDHLDRLPFRRLDKKVVVHDSCTARQIGEYEPVRRLLGAIPGLELVEMANNREDVFCCGAATHPAVPDLAIRLADTVMSQAKDTGADTLATLCSGCQRRFGRLAEDQPLSVESFITVVGEALGIRYEDRYKRFLRYHDPERVIAESAEYIAASACEPAELERLVRKYFK